MANTKEELLNDIFGSESELSDVEDELQVQRSASPPGAGATPAARASPSPSPPMRFPSSEEERPEDEYREQPTLKGMGKIAKKGRRGEEAGMGDEGRKVKRRKRERRERSPRATQGEEEGEAPVPVEMTAEEKRRFELDQRLDSIIKPNKGARRRRRNRGEDDTFADDEIVKLKEQMMQAAFEDEESIVGGKPAIQKLKMLPEVMDIMQRPSYQNALLENGLLEAVTKWLEPIRIDKSLPAMNIQNALFGVLQKMYVDTDSLRQCDLGKVVLFYTKSPRVQEHIKRAADQLVDTWSRPIINRSSNYRDLIIPTAASPTSSAPGQLSLAKILAEGKQAADKNRRIRIPERNMGVYTVAPASQVSGARAGDGEEARERRRREQERLRRLQNKLKMAKQANARV